MNKKILALVGAFSLSAFGTAQACEISARVSVVGNELLMNSLPLNLRATESNIKIFANNHSIKLLGEGKLNYISPKVENH